MSAMKQEFEQALSFLEQRYADRPRGFDLFNKSLMANMVRAFDETAATVYVSGYAFTTELLWAFDVVPFDFEIACNNLSAAVGGHGSTLMTVSENEGFSRDVCSFDRLIISCMMQGMLPAGDLFLTSSYYCQGKAKANEIVARNQGLDSVLFDVPHEKSRDAVRYVTAQLKQIASRLEKITGTRLDMDRFKESVRSSNRARASMQTVNDLMKNRPCPWDGVRACLLSLAGGLLWGAPVLEEIYGMLARELKGRVDKGAVLPESKRVLWYPWVPVQRTNIFDTLKEHQVSIPVVEVATVWWSELDEDHPFEALAVKALENFLVGPARGRVERLAGLAEWYEVDGVIHFHTPACHQENAAFSLVREAMRDRGLPAVNLQGDMTDERNYSSKQTYETLTAFLETMKAGARN
ncbi:MAG: 2-hydroxyacyl-CoA dehydratase family protein [Proteobacteria bacterium]|nr:2-hydroxyacyl-CoA dehydratase family protein [Pseudomonadota bacterium]